MLRTAVEDRLWDHHGEDGYLFPAYEDYCFANVPHTVGSMLGVDTGRPLPDDVLPAGDPEPGIVLVVLIDGLGLSVWKRDRGRHTLLDTVTDRGIVTPLTSVYPSETTAALTTFHTGTLPAEHGGIGWNVYEPLTDECFEALTYQRKDGSRPALEFSKVFAARSIYRQFSAAGVDVHHVTPYPHELGGVTMHGIDSPRDLPETLPAVLSAAEPPAYVFTYLSDIDTISHETGTESTAFHETLETIAMAIERAIAQVDLGTARDTLLILTADHGHVDTDPERNVDLSTVDGLVDQLASDGNGEPIRLVGSPRNVHLHLRPGAASVREAIEREVDARLFTREEALDCGLFGAPPSETFRRRLGDLIVAPRDRSAWWGNLEPGELAHVGMHGGLHPDEMLVPFGTVELAALR